MGDVWLGFLSSRLRSQEGTALQMGGVLRYKLEVCCQYFSDKLYGLGALEQCPSSRSRKSSAKTLQRESWRMSFAEVMLSLLARSAVRSLGEGHLGLPGKVGEPRCLLSFPSFPRESRSSENVWENAWKFQTSFYQTSAKNFGDRCWLPIPSDAKLLLTKIKNLKSLSAQKLQMARIFP